MSENRTEILKCRWNALVEMFRSATFRTREDMLRALDALGSIELEIAEREGLDARYVLTARPGCPNMVSRFVVPRGKRWWGRGYGDPDGYRMAVFPESLAEFISECNRRAKPGYRPDPSDANAGRNVRAGRNIDAPLRRLLRMIERYKASAEINRTGRDLDNIRHAATELIPDRGCREKLLKGLFVGAVVEGPDDKGRIRDYAVTGQGLRRSSRQRSTRRDGVDEKGRFVHELRVWGYPVRMSNLKPDKRMPQDQNDLGNVRVIAASLAEYGTKIDKVVSNRKRTKP